MSESTKQNDLPTRCVTIDVEEYYHIESAYDAIPKAKWHDWPSRVQRNVDLLLALLGDRQQRATFFVLGDVAKRTPQAVRAIAEAGHEIASHGSLHDRLHRLNPQSFRDDLSASRQTLEDVAGQAVVGYRAPTFSIVPETAWAIDVLLELGFEYDSSVFPVKHALYGVPAAPDRPYWIAGGGSGGRLLEMPPLTWSPTGPLAALARSRGGKLPVAGGGYFRLLPLWLMKQGLRQAAAQRRPAVLYFHPWEFDPGTPRMPLGWKGRLRTYTGLKSAARNLATILDQPARWVAMADLLEGARQSADAQPTFRLDEAGGERATAA